ncbi:hypothetical protein [Desertivirga brevis]|uniref:hypothetical protein n=1 Tax=Desertivirga brevis TaxID=2810310 RepID=UPI001A9620FE|nr:hypothetical protein [Pedobacter sp. SYSU D00873]
MNFFKKLFGKKTGSSNGANQGRANFSGVYSTEHFNERYNEFSLEKDMLDGCLKMIEGYFIDNQIERIIEGPVNHPANLDQVDQSGFGFVLYCQAFELSEGEATMFLAFAFSDYLITKYGFKLYKDQKPDHPLRGMTLKYDKDGVVLSLYPFEYTVKVLKGNETFSALEEKLKANLKELPKVDELLKNFGIGGDK